MKRGKECGDGSLTVSYSVRCQLDQLIRNNFLSRALLSFKSREAPSFSLTGSTEGTRVLIHSCLMTCFGPQLQAQISQSFYSKCDNLPIRLRNRLELASTRCKPEIWVRPYSKAQSGRAICFVGFAWHRGVEQFHQTRFIRITHWRLAIWLNPLGMLDPQVVVNL